MNIDSHYVEKHRVMGLIEGGDCTIGEAAGYLGISYRQAKRYWKRYREACGSLVEFVPAPRGPAWNRLSTKTEDEIAKLKVDNTLLSNAHIADLIAERLDVSVCPASVRRVLIDRDLYAGTKTGHRVRKRFESEAFGERLQIDTTEGAWLEGYRTVYLIAVIDEYSRMLVGWKWVDSDSKWNNMCVLRSVYEKYGLPKMLYTDNASMFKTIRHGRSIYQKHRREGYETEIQRAMRELGVNMFSHRPYEPQSKGKVERFFRFMQGRFLKEHAAKNLGEMNEQFEKWAEWYNGKHTIRTIKCKPKDRRKPNAFRPVSSDELSRAICFKLTRKIDKCNSFSLDGITYTLPEKTCLVHRTVDVEYTPETVRVYYKEKLIQEFERIHKE